MALAFLSALVFKSETPCSTIVADISKSKVPVETEEEPSCPSFIVRVGSR
jgi:hypothetical protein